MSDILAKTLKTFLHPTTDDNTRANAHAAVLRIIGDKDIKLAIIDDDSEQEETTRLRKELNAEKLKIFELESKFQSWHEQLEILLDALRHQTIFRQRSKGLPNAESYIIDKLLENPEGVSKRELLDECSTQEEKDSIHRRWSEAKKAHFLINPERGDEVMVHDKFRDRYPNEWHQHKQNCESNNKKERANV